MSNEHPTADERVTLEELSEQVRKGVPVSLIEGLAVIEYQERLRSDKRFIPLRCRVFGHKWEASHRKDIMPNGLTVWVYTDHICTRCYSTEWKMPHAKGQ